MAEPQPPERPQPPTGIAAGVQATALLVLAAYSGYALARSTVPDRWTLVALASLGLGARPETLVDILRKVIK